MWTKHREEPYITFCDLVVQCITDKKYLKRDSRLIWQDPTLFKYMNILFQHGTVKWNVFLHHWLQSNTWQLHFSANPSGESLPLPTEHTWGILLCSSVSILEWEKVRSQWNYGLFCLWGKTHYDILYYRRDTPKWESCSMNLECILALQRTVF